MKHEEFSERLRRVIFDSAGEARAMRHRFIGCEHLLVAMLAAQSNAAEALRSYGLTYDTLRIMVDNRSVKLEEPRKLSEFTPEVDPLFERALHEARTLRHDTVEPEHLLLALTNSEPNAATELLVEAGCDLGEINQSVMTLLATESVQAKDAKRLLQEALELSQENFKAARRRYAQAQDRRDLALGLVGWEAEGQRERHDELLDSFKEAEKLRDLLIAVASRL